MVPLGTRCFLQFVDNRCLLQSLKDSLYFAIFSDCVLFGWVGWQSWMSTSWTSTRSSNTGSTWSQSLVEGHFHRKKDGSNVVTRSWGGWGGQQLLLIQHTVILVVPLMLPVFVLFVLAPTVSWYSLQFPLWGQCSTLLLVWWCYPLLRTILSEFKQDSCVLYYTSSLFACLCTHICTHVFMPSVLCYRHVHVCLQLTNTTVALVSLCWTSYLSVDPLVFCRCCVWANRSSSLSAVRRLPVEAPCKSC